MWALRTHLIDALRKIKHPYHGSEGFAPYLRTTAEQVLVSGLRLTTPDDQGAHFLPSLVDLTDQMISVEENRWKAECELADGFQIIETVFTQVYETCVDVASHTDATGMGQRDALGASPRGTSSSS